MTALLALSLSASAAIKNLYSWGAIADTDWANKHGNVGVTVTSDAEGSYYKLTNSGGGARGAVTFWGDKIGEYTKYSIKLDFNIASYLTNDAGRYLGAEFTFLSSDVDATTFSASANALQSTNYVLDFTQRYGDNGVAPDWNVGTFYVNGYGGENTVIFPLGAWYTLTVDVDGQNVSYNVKEAGNPEAAAVFSGTTTVPEGISNKAIGLYVRLARGQGALSLGNLMLTTEVEGAVANEPTITLTEVWQAERTYGITFTGEDETLHYILPGGDEQTIDYWTANPDGNPTAIVNVTATQSGTLRAWTTNGDAKSAEVTAEVVAEVEKLVDPTYIINEVESGYGKVYRVSIDNTMVTLAPQIFLTGTFTPDGAGTGFTDQAITNGGTIKVDGKGTLVIKANTILINEGVHAGTRAYGESSITIVNDKEYELNTAKSINFAHMTEAELVEAGFAADGNVSGNWASYGRLFGYDETTMEQENPTKLVYGGDDQSTLEHTPIPQYTKKSSAFADGTMFKGLYCVGNAEGTESASPNVNVHVWRGVGLNLEGKKGDDMDGNWINYAYFLIEGLTENDFTATYGGGNYGNGGDKDSNHPAVKDLADLSTKVQTEVNLIENTCTIRKGTECIPLYRISDAIGRIDVYSPVGSIVDGIEAIKDVKTANQDAPIYNLNGVQVNPNALQKGIYIKQGKKFIGR